MCTVARFPTLDALYTLIDIFFSELLNEIYPMKFPITLYFSALYPSSIKTTPNPPGNLEKGENGDSPAA